MAELPATLHTEWSQPSAPRASIAKCLVRT